MLDADHLLGQWQLLRCETPLEIEPGTRMRFSADGMLEYAIPTAQGDLQLTLRWRLHVATLHTEHLDGSNPVTVSATLGAGEVLTFDFGGPRAWFVRVQ